MALSATVLGGWASGTRHHGLRPITPRGDAADRPCRAAGGGGIVVLMVLIFSKYFYLASLSSYYTFYLIHHFHLSVRDAQLHLFAFLAAVAVGTMAAARSATASAAST